jgi:hypothetical protein
MDSGICNSYLDNKNYSKNIKNFSYDEDLNDYCKNNINKNVIKFDD